MDLERLALIRSIRETALTMSLPDLNLLLRELEVSGIEENDWYGGYNYSVDDDGRRDILAQRLTKFNTQQLGDFAQALESVFDRGAPVVNFEQPEPLTLFASHLHAQAAFVKEVADVLETWGVNMFVAHVDIHPGDAWHATIELNLASRDAGVAFLMPGFIKSQWCDQEVGWLLGRGAPVLGLKFGQDPYGPLGKVQAINGAPLNAQTLAAQIIEWANGETKLRRKVLASSVSALEKSPSFHRTDVLWGRIKGAADLTGDEVIRMANAVRDNRQVYGASSADGDYADLLLNLAVRQPGYAGNEALVKEAAKLRGVVLLTGAATAEDDAWVTPTRGTAEETPF